jgi:hypothetical protein
VGLLAFGDAFVTTLDGVLTYRIVDPPEPLPESFVGVKWAALSGITLTLGLAISCIGMVIPDSQKTIAIAGRMVAVRCWQFKQFYELAGTDNSDPPLCVQGQMLVVRNDPA